MEIKSKLMQCPNGHYFNGAIHDKCPICGGASAGQQAGTSVGQQAGAFPGTMDPAAEAGNFPGTMDPHMGSVVPGGNFPGTMDPHMVTSNNGGAFPPTMDPNNKGNFPPTANPYDDSYNPFPKTMIGGEPDGVPVNVEPVVGWLVCVEGSVKGKDFKVRSGYNYIGRQEGDILIPGDNQISRKNHAMIAYDPSDNIYYFGPSTGRNLIKVNGRTIFNPVEIRNYDVISMGSTKLMFVGLCGDRFDWNRGVVNG